MAETRARRYVLPPLLLMAAVLVLAVDVFPIRQLAALNGQAEELRTQLAEIREENDRLEEEVKLLYSPAAIERIARSDFGYVNPGETSYVVFGTDDIPEGRQADSEPETLIPESSGFFDALRDFITGRDISDG